jgi:hypothetical protein
MAIDAITDLLENGFLTLTIMENMRLHVVIFINMNQDQAGRQLIINLT